MKPIALNEDEFRRLHISNVKAEIYKTQDVNIPVHGELVISFSLTGYHSESRELRLPLLSAWTYHSKPTVQMLCKAHVGLPDFRRKLKKTLVNPDMAMLQRLLAWLYKRRGFNYHGARPTMRLSVDDRFSILRYATEDPIVPFPAPMPGGSQWDTVPIFDTKSLALQEIFRVISKYSKTIVSGVDLIDLNKVSDSVLEEIGFLKVPDQMGRGVAMWQGDAERIATLGKSSFRTGYSRYSSQRDHRSDASAATQEVINSFLDILETELSV